MKVLHVAAGLPSKEKPFHQPFIKSQIDSLSGMGINILVHEVKGYKSKFHYYKSIAEIKKLVLKENIDIIHAHYSYCGLISYFARTKKPIVLSLMGSDLFGIRTTDGKITSRGKMDRMITNYISKRVDHVIVKSNNMKNRLNTSVPVSIIPNGVDFEMFKPKDTMDSRKKIGLNAKDFIILFLGNPIDLVKNFGLANLAVELLKEKKSDVMFLKPFGIGQSDVVDYMNAANVLLLTSHYEGSPNIIKEAMACNLPIISVNVGDVATTIKGVSNCYLVKYSADDIVEKLLKIYEQRGRTNGRNRISHLNINDIAKRIDLIYSELLNA